MKKLFLLAPLTLALYACGDEEVKEPVEPVKQEEKETNQEKFSTANEKEWEVDERLQEPTEDTVCALCNMKVYTKDHELGVFTTQAIQEDGSVVFYDDIGCLLNDEHVHQTTNEKFVRDYNTLNWFNIDEAIIVKTDKKSPMNWGYIFFKYQEDADAYIAVNDVAIITPLEQVRDEGIERHKQMQQNGGHGHDHSHDHTGEDGHANEGGHLGEKDHSEKHEGEDS